MAGLESLEKIRVANIMNQMDHSVKSTPCRNLLELKQACPLSRAKVTSSTTEIHEVWVPDVILQMKLGTLYVTEKQHTDGRQAVS